MKELSDSEVIDVILEWIQNYPKISLEKEKIDPEYLRRLNLNVPKFVILCQSFSRAKTYYDSLIENRDRISFRNLEKAYLGGISKLRIDYIARIYGVDKSYIEELLQEYSSMENFLDALRKGKIKNENGISKNLRKFFDVDFRPNFDKLLEDVFKIKTYMTDKRFRIYSSKFIEQIMDELPIEQRMVLKYYYGLPEGQRHIKRWIAMNLNISENDVVTYYQEGLKNLREMDIFSREGNLMCQLINWQDGDCVVRDDLSPESEELLEKLRILIFNSSDILYSTIDYGSFSGNSDKGDDVRNGIREILDIFRNKMPQKEFRIISLKTTLEDATNRGIISWEGARTINALRRNGILTVGDLITKTLDGRGIGKKGYDEALRQRQNLLVLFPELISKNLNERVTSDKENPLASLQQDISVLGLQQGTVNLLRRNKIFNIKELLEYGLSNLMNIPQLGINTYLQIKSKIEKYALGDTAVQKMYREINANRLFSQIPIQEFGFPDDINCILLKAKINTAAELLKYDEESLLEIGVIGKRKLKPILIVLEKLTIIQRERDKRQSVKEALNESKVPVVLDADDLEDCPKVISTKIERLTRRRAYLAVKDRKFLQKIEEGRNFLEQIALKKYGGNYEIF